ncbi:MAG: spore coat protein CotJB [Clostridia bacterium]|nr:spore coat protein CotJB [Clostridia bacterium]
MNDKQKLFKKILELDFALHELNLFLDTHPDNEKALRLLGDYRSMRKSAVEEYENRFGRLIIMPCDAPTTKPWQWINGPWPWEIGFGGE